MQELKDRMDRLEKQPIVPDYFPNYGGKARMLFDPECLHNSCNHEKNPVCHLYCPHCGPKC